MSEIIVETKQLTKQYGTQKSVAELNIHVQRGRIYGLLGRNGAGKTTTMKMLLGLTQPTSGKVTIWGKSLLGNEKKLLPRIGSLIESPGFYPNLTGTENLRIFAALRGLKNQGAIKNALELVGLPYRDKKLFSQYSLGMKQRLAIALAVMHDPELLILDEPINGLDPIGIAEVRSFIRALCDERGKTILISSHILSEVALLADDIGIIDHGVLLEEEGFADLEAKSNKYVRFTVSDTNQAAEILRAECEAIGVQAEIEAFQIEDADIETAAFEILEPFHQEYQVTGFKCAQNTPEGGLTADFLYVENGLDVNLIDAAGKIVLVNGYLRVPVFRKLLKAGAAAIVTMEGELRDKPEETDLSTRALRKTCGLWQRAHGEPAGGGRHGYGAQRGL